MHPEIEALAEYLLRMNPAIQKTISNWGQAGGFKFYPRVKRLTLEMAAEVFLGLGLSGEVDQVNQDFATLVEASSGIVRYGLHRQDAAMMTCFTPSVMRSDHVHFIDGARGGYASAATALKATAA